MLNATGFAVGDALSVGILEVGDRDGKGVGRIGWRGFPKLEHGADHEGDLLLVGRAFSNSREFHFAGRVVINRDSKLGSRQEAGTACRAKNDGCFVALDKDGGLDGADGGRVGADGVLQALSDGNEATRRQKFGRALDRAVCEDAKVTAIALDDGVAGVSQCRIDGEDAIHGARYGRGRDGLLAGDPGHSILEEAGGVSIRRTFSRLRSRD